MRVEKRILVVDDDDAIRALVITVLKRRGFHVDGARNGDEALARLELCHYALLILDLMMPLRSGYEVLDDLATRPAATRPLVLVLTAGLEPRPFDTTFVVGTMHKPFDIELLVDTAVACMAALEGQPQLDQCPPGSATGDTASGKTN